MLRGNRVNHHKLLGFSVKSPADTHRTLLSTVNTLTQEMQNIKNKHISEITNSISEVKQDVQKVKNNDVQELATIVSNIKQDVNKMQDLTTIVSNIKQDVNKVQDLTNILSSDIQMIKDNDANGKLQDVQNVQDIKLKALIDKNNTIEYTSYQLQTKLFDLISRIAQLEKEFPKEYLFDESTSLRLLPLEEKELDM